VATDHGLSLAALPEREAQFLGLGIVIDEELQSWRRSPRAAWPDSVD